MIHEDVIFLVSLKSWSDDSLGLWLSGPLHSTRATIGLNLSPEGHLTAGTSTSQVLSLSHIMKY